MKVWTVWCCFGSFGEGGERKDMKEGSGREVEDRRGVEDEESEGLGRILGLGLPFSENARESRAGRWDRGEHSELRLLLGNASSSTWGAAAASASSSGMRKGEFDVGEESSGAALERESCNGRDWHHKRPKVHSFLPKHTDAVRDVDRSCSHADGENNVSLESSILSRNDVFYHFPLFNNGRNETSCDFSGGRDAEGDEFGTSISEDIEVHMDLTDDLLHMVFSFLDHVDLCRAAIVCRQWRTASAHEEFWRSLNFENRNISLRQFEDICRRYPNASKVNVLGTLEVHSFVMRAVSSLRNLETLILGRGHVGDTFFHALGECHMLKSLVVNDAILGNGIQEIPIIHDKLRHLDIIKCRTMRISVRCPQLESLSLKRSYMTHALLSCPLLHDLDMGSCHKLSDAAIRSAATSCPVLESLDLSNCSCVSDETLREIALSSANLHVLDASYCPNISLESVRLPMLMVLKLHSCEGITSASMAAISHSYMLEVLELDNCNLLTSVSLELSRLQSIRLVHCRKLTDLSLRNDMLSAITVSNCPLLNRISITSNSLEKLVLQKQESLSTLALQCHGLKEVDLTDCESLTDSVCEVFNEGGGCPTLRTLILDNCESLKDVRFCSASLVSLSLAGCRAITSIELNCPYLEQVSLDGCDHLERASFRPVGLRSLNLGICPKLNALNIEAPQMLLLELKGCGVLSEASIRCPLLTSLDASFCSQLKDDCLSATSVTCPLIESLILMLCPSVGSDGLYALRRLQHLTLLDLSYTFLMNLQPVFDSCLQLKVLKLQACKYLNHSSLEALYKNGALPSLQELDLSYGTLCQSAIEELLKCCTHLTHVSLNGCENMHDLNWGFDGSQHSEFSSIYGSSGVPSYEYEPPPNRLLQNLNCVGCPNIKKVIIPPIARCFHLSSLNLSLSANLKEASIACSSLSFLNLSNCCALESLDLKCPRLTSLFLQSCNIDEAAVEAAISQCNMLETLDIRFCPKVCCVSMGKLRGLCPSLKRIFSSLPQ